MNRRTLRVARVKVTADLVAEALPLPGGSVIRDGYYNRENNVFELWVEHPDLDPVLEGDSVPERAVVVTKSFTKSEFLK